MKESNEPKTVLESEVSIDYLETYFPVVKANSLSLDDEFLKHVPATDLQVRVKERLISAIKSGLTDFRAQRMDPSLDENGNIYYEYGKDPAICKSAIWWLENAQAFMPEKRSRLGKTKERIVFLGLLIKYLVEEEKYEVSDAWKSVCDQSKELLEGQWPKKENKFKSAGCKKVDEWYDLGNTYKLTVHNDNGYEFALVGEIISNLNYKISLADICTVYNPKKRMKNTVGWIVMDV